MNASPDFDADRLQAGASGLGVPLTAAQVRQFSQFARLIHKWNQVHNLTAIRESARVITHHLLDSLALVAPLRGVAARGANVLDVGSGGGFPGIPLAIACPEFQLTLVDSVRKKCAFLTQVQLALRLANVAVAHARVEHWKGGEFDVIVSRAFASLRDFTGWTRHLLRAGGVWLAMKGPDVDSELGDLGDVAARTQRLAVPGLDEERTLVVLRPIRATGEP